LALSPDVDQTQTRWNSDGDRGQNKRNHADEDFGYAVGGAEGLGKNVDISAERVFAGNEEHRTKGDQYDKYETGVA
jgi:hypothetical protein